VRYLIIFFLIININQTYAGKIGSATGFKIPRFVSLKSNDVNLRVGPSINYPIKIKYIQENFPVEVIDEYDLWRQIQDFEGNKGWIHKSLLKGDRYGIIKSNSNDEGLIFTYPNGNLRGKIGDNNIVKIKKCLETWCLIGIEKNKGWVNKEDLWGVYNKEIYKIGFMQPLKNWYWKVLDVIYKN